MNWTKEQIKNHKEAGRLLGKIMKEAFLFISKGKNISEKDVQKFIIKQFEKYNLKTADQELIIGFDENSAIPHYFPAKNSKILKPETFILIDIWARLKKRNSPFADITWVAYFGAKVPKEIDKVFKIVVSARDAALNLVQDKIENGEFPTGKKVDQVAIKIISKVGYKKNIFHRTGHSIGFNSPHGKKEHLNSDNNKKIEKNLGYTIEPGIYFPGKFGIRSEIDFYVDERNKVQITTPMQKKVVIIDSGKAFLAKGMICMLEYSISIKNILCLK